MAEIFGCKVEDLNDGEVLRVEHAPECIALFRVEGKFYATADLCTHADWSLSLDSEVVGYEVECSLHQARFDVRTGSVTQDPATVPLSTYPVRVDDGTVWIDIGD